MLSKSGRELYVVRNPQWASKPMGLKRAIRTMRVSAPMVEGRFCYSHVDCLERLSDGKRVALGDYCSLRWSLNKREKILLALSRGCKQ